MSDTLAEAKSYQDAIKGEKITKNGGGAPKLTAGDEEILDRLWDERAKQGTQSQAKPDK